ncbi:Cu2+-exporting ATPase [Rubrivivax gelatinosus]|uniref:Cu2+-exporting ATPase n=2 Tax=Rubrivivax gelatinosus TaxID=28068 RepID=A0A4R2M751_RUBGE|nr:Cu2+-exporting ATPase [Rubrivivax gelatinosus]
MSLSGIAPLQQAAPSLAAVDDPLELARFTRWVQEGDGVRLGESALQISGMYCAACTGILENALGAVDGVREARVSAAAQRATVRWDPARTKPSELIDAIRRAGYDAVPDAAAPAREMRRAEHRAALWRLFVASFCAMQVMMFATPSYVAGPGELSMEMRQLLNWGCWVLSIPVVLFSAGPFFRGAWRGLRTGRIGMDVPVCIGVAVTFVASTGATFDPAGVFGHEVYFDSLTMFVSFLLAGRYLELRARHRAAGVLEGALARLPETAQRLGADGSVTEVSVQRLVAGDHVRVALGQAFPADGVLVDGSTQADESLLTGESVAVEKPCGAAVVAASVNLGAPVTMRVERAGADTRYEAIVSMMRDAMSQRPALARVADRWAVPFLWAVLVLAAGSAAVWSVVDPSRAIWVAVSVLIVTCPCALSLAAPATMIAAAAGLARRGVLVQRLDALEDLARTGHLFIDKTGTLTEDRPVLATTLVFDEGVDALGHAASLAAWSRHPLSQALAASLPASGRAWSSVDEVAGAGLRASDEDGVEWRLGGAVFAGAAEREDVQVWLSRAGRPVAGFGFDEFLRAGAEEALRELRADGVRVTLLSGDAPARAARLAGRLGLDSFVGGARPEDKLAAVAAAQHAGERVTMVGDGVNDAPVLARADVSLAMGQGALVARAQADAVLVSNRPLDIVAARRTAARAMRIVRQNMIWAAAYNAACIPLALIGWLPPWAAGLGMAGSSLFVVLNALRAGR